MAPLLSPNRRSLGDTAVPSPSPHSPVPVYSDRLAQESHDHDQQQHTASSRPWEGAHARRVNLERKGFLKAKSSRRQLGAQTSSTVIDDSENESDDDMDFLSPKNKSHTEPVKSDPISDAPFRSKVSSTASKTRTRSTKPVDLTRPGPENRQLPNTNNKNNGAKLNLINVRTVFPSAPGQSSGRVANKSTSQQSRSTKCSQVSDRSQPSMPALPSQSRSQSSQNTNQSTDNSVELLPRQPQDFSIQATARTTRPMSSAKPVKSHLAPPHHPFPSPSTHHQPSVVRSPSPSSAATRSAVSSTSQSTLGSTASDRAYISAPGKRKNAPAQEPQRVFKKRLSSSPLPQPEKPSRQSPEVLDGEEDQDEEELQPKKQSVTKKPQPKPKPKPRVRQDSPLPPLSKGPANARERTPPRKESKEKRRPRKRLVAESESSEDEDALPMLSPEKSMRDDTGDLLEGFTQIIGKRDPNAKLCPFCDEPLPPNPSARLLRIIDAFKQSSSAVDRPSLLNPKEAIALPFHMSSKVCSRHRDEAEVIPYGLEQGWPAEGQIDFDLLPRRVRKLSKHLRLVIDGTRSSEFLDAAHKEWGEQGHMKMQNLLHQFASFDVEIPGYYGTIGFEVLLGELQQLFSQHPQLAAHRIRPLDTDSYIRRVLLPETAVRLIMEDRLCPEAEAKAHLEDSRAYGVAVHAPLDDLEGIESMH